MWDPTKTPALAAQAERGNLRSLGILLRQITKMGGNSKLIGTNIAFGTNALVGNTTGANNVAVGYQAMDANTIGDKNIAVGSAALGANTTGAENVAVGHNALDAQTTGMPSGREVAAS